MDTTTSATDRATFLPKHAPVTVLHLCADNDRNGNPRRCFAVLEAGTGRHVETIDEDYIGESALYGRYPWFHSSVALRHELVPAYAVRVDVAPAEYRRWMRREASPAGEVPSLDRIRARADRYAARFDYFGQPRARREV
jgi:hypothetical protein